MSFVDGEGKWLEGFSSDCDVLLTCRKEGVFDLVMVGSC